MEQEEALERWEAEGGAISIKKAVALGICQQEAVGSTLGTRNKALLQELAQKEEAPMTNRHIPRLCKECKAPLAAQEDACWKCGHEVDR